MPDASESKGRKRGAQPGYPGKARNLKPVDEVDHVIDFKLQSCAQCGRGLGGEDAHPERHQVSEVPMAPALLTEYRRHTLRCRHCGRETRADWPAEMSRRSFGPRAQALIGYFTGRLGLSHRDAAEAMQALHGLEVGLGSIASIQRGVSAALAESVEGARHFVQQQYADAPREKSDYRTWPALLKRAQIKNFDLEIGR